MTEHAADRPTTAQPGAEIEGKGLDYERFAMNKLFHRMVRERGIRNVLELPAKGEKAMPSLYSIAFGQAGCPVTLVNPEPKSEWAWNALDYPVERHHCENVSDTGLPARGYDLVWDFMFLAQFGDKDGLLREMKRLSRRWILYIGVNRFNPGFFSHRTVHRIFDVPWTHGDVAFMNPFRVRRFFEDHDLTVVRTGVVDCPPYPDSLGIRDMKLHRKNVDLNKIDWDSRTFAWMRSGEVPLKLRLFYLVEKLPLPWRVKLAYAHLFWVLGVKR
jgi:hypothetical protein